MKNVDHDSHLREVLPFFDPFHVHLLTCAWTIGLHLSTWFWQIEYKEMSLLRLAYKDYSSVLDTSSVSFGSLASRGSRLAYCELPTGGESPHGKELVSAATRLGVGGTRGLPSATWVSSEAGHPPGEPWHVCTPGWHTDGSLVRDSEAPREATPGFLAHRNCGIINACFNPRSLGVNVMQQ